MSTAKLTREVAETAVVEYRGGRFRNAGPRGGPAATSKSPRPSWRLDRGRAQFGARARAGSVTKLAIKRSELAVVLALRSGVEKGPNTG